MFALVVYLGDRLVRSVWSYWVTVSTEPFLYSSCHPVMMIVTNDGLPQCRITSALIKSNATSIRRMCMLFLTTPSNECPSGAMASSYVIGVACNKGRQTAITLIIHYHLATDDIVRLNIAVLLIADASTALICCFKQSLVVATKSFPSSLSVVTLWAHTPVDHFA